MTKKKEKLKTKIFLYIQAGLTLIVGILFVLVMFKRSFFPLLQLILGIALIIMAYNNQVIYKKKKATILYLVIGILLLILDLLQVMGV